MQMEAKAAGFDNGVFIDELGFVGESSNMNVAFITRDGVLRHPKFERVLPGCTSLRVLELARGIVGGGVLTGVEVGDIAAAVAALGREPRRVFLAIGRKEVAAFAAAPQHHYLIRSVDPIEPPLSVPDATYIRSRGPFAENDEKALLSQHRVETIVAKNSGGAATYGKIAAARALGLSVIMLRRPALPDVATVDDPHKAVAWLDHQFPPSTKRGV
jgi:precorrin-6x reductase